MSDDRIAILEFQNASLREDLLLSDTQLETLARHQAFYEDEKLALIELVEARAQIVRMRNLLLLLASECAECNGTGKIAVFDCTECRDIREVLL